MAKRKVAQEEKPMETPAVKLAEAKDIPRCKKHPESPAVIDKRGQSLGRCMECLQERGKASGEKNRCKPKMQIAISTLDALFTGYEDLLSELKALAKEEIRTPEQQLIWIVGKYFRVKK